jgi:hypothetical protein
VMEFGEWLCGHVLRPVPHRHFVLSIPKILRRFFLHDRKLLAVLLIALMEPHEIGLMEPLESGRLRGLGACPI